MRSFTAAVIQTHAGGDKSANVAGAVRLVESAARGGAELVALPEVFAWRGRQADEATAAESLPGPTSERMAALARTLRIYLVAGSLLERCDHGGRSYNTCLLFGPDGSTLAAYRKIHLFDVDLPGRVSIRESQTRAPGDTPVAIRTELGVIGLAVCYDLRFPELFRRLAGDGAEIIVMPSAFTRPTGEAHWEPLVRARAIENQCFLLAPDQYGTGAAGFAAHGHSLIVDPWGKVLAEGPPDGDATLLARLDAQRLTTVRAELPCLEHRRL